MTTNPKITRGANFIRIVGAIHMEESTLKKYFEDLTSKIDDLKENIKAIDDRQRGQFKKVIILEEQHKTMGDNMKEHKINVRLGIGIAFPVMTAIFLFVGKLFL